MHSNLRSNIATNTSDSLWIDFYYSKTDQSLELKH